MTESAEQALSILRDASLYQWYVIPLFALVVYVYAVEIERRNWNLFFAGLAFWGMDWFNEIWNSLVFHFTGYAPVWGAPGQTAYLILIGLNLLWGSGPIKASEGLVYETESSYNYIQVIQVPDGQGGVITIFNMNPGKPTKGWNQIMTLPRKLTLVNEDEVLVEPAGDVTSLRREHVHVGPLELEANQEVVLEAVYGKTIEIEAVIAPSDAPVGMVPAIWPPKATTSGLMNPSTVGPAAENDAR